MLLLAFMCFPAANITKAKLQHDEDSFNNLIEKTEKQSDNAERHWSRLIQAISMTESGGDARAVSRCGRYVGHLQISKVMVRTCNEIAGYRKYKYSDRYNHDKSVQMFIEFQTEFNPEADIEYAIRLWNTGDIDCMKNKRSSESYYRRVMKNYKALGEVV